MGIWQRGGNREETGNMAERRKREEYGNMEERMEERRIWEYTREEGRETNMIIWQQEEKSEKYGRGRRGERGIWEYGREEGR